MSRSHQPIQLSIISLKAQNETSALRWGFAVASLNSKNTLENQCMNMKQAFGFRASSEVIIDVLTARVVRHEPSWP